MNQKQEVSVVAWWRYPVAILAFIAAYFLLPILIGDLLTLVHYFTPGLFKSTALWLFVLSHIISAALGFSVVETLMLEQKYVFQAIWATIVAIYSFFVAITNWFWWSSSPEQLLGALAMGIVSIVCVGYCAKRIKIQKTI